MKTITEQLADALRAILPFAERDVGELAYLACDDDSEDEAMGANADVERARQALAAYDAQQARPVSVKTQDVDRVLGMADQFLEDWRESVDDDIARDSELEEREKEWPVIRALILQRVNAHDGLVSALRDIDETCQAGLNSSVYSHWSAALEDSMQAARAALAQAGVTP